MRPKKPSHVLLDQVRITREGDDAIIDHADANLSGARIAGSSPMMSDADIVEMYNEILDAQWRLLQAWDKTAVEEPPGEKQIDYHENRDQWVPRARTRWSASPSPPRWYRRSLRPGYCWRAGLSVGGRPASRRDQRHRHPVCLFGNFLGERLSAADVDETRRRPRLPAA